MDREPGIRPLETIWRRLDVAARYCAPAALTGFVLLLLSLPAGMPGQAEMQPAWALACVFFWSLFRPASLPPVAVFLLGLLLDLLAEGPVGLHPLLLLLVQAACLRWRRALTRMGFVQVWLAFGAVAAVAALAEYAAASLLAWRGLAPWPAMLEAGLAIGAYPGLSMLLTRAHQGIAAPERA